LFNIDGLGIDSILLRLFEVRFHGRGGQGAVTASQLLVKAAFLEGKWGQSIPMFGAERRGAPVLAFARISSKPIRRHMQIYEPDAVVVLDSKIFNVQDVTSGLKSNGFLIVNDRRKPGELGFKGFKVGVVNATDIAVKLGLYFAGFPAVNTAMVGALARATGIVSIDSVVKAIMNTWSGRLGELNAEAARQAYNSIVIEEV